MSAAAILPLPEPSPLPFDPAMPPADRHRLLVAALPEPLSEILAAGRLDRRPRFGDNGFDGLSEVWSPPATVTARQAAMAQWALADLEGSVLAPAEPDRLLARILTLLSHYPAKGLTPEVEQLVAMDWVEDLGEFPGWAIEQAARSWRRTQKWRPSIAEMRALCEEACAKERQLAECLRKLSGAGQHRPSSPGFTRPAGTTCIRRFP